MKLNFYKSLFTSLFCLLLFAANSQDRYLDEVFSGHTVTADVKYGSNITIITSPPSAQDLLADVYEPADDTLSDRPLVIVIHTGSFLPPLFNGGVTGARSDSAVTETCRRLARRGFVVAAITYRQGWLPESLNQNLRTGTLLQAAYRGIQDTRSAVRFFRKDVAEAGNTYGIDPSKIALWGIGTGGYMSMGAATLDRFEEVTLDKFIDSETFLPYIDTTLFGNLRGTTQKPLCLPNHPNYSDDVGIAINMGGALGDSTWLDGATPPPITGIHVLRDPFAPFHDGAVIVPTTMQFVVNVSGTHSVVDKMNQRGHNDIFKNIPADKDPLSPIINFMNNVPIDLPTGVTIPLAVPNMYPLVTPTFQAGPWDWWGKPQLDQVVAFVNATFMQDFNSDTLHITGQLVNPGMSKEKGMAYLDTTFMLFAPRVCAALGLGCGFTVSTETLDPLEIGFTFGPNPVSDRMNVSSKSDFPMEDISVYDLQGRLVMKHVQINDNNFSFGVDHLTSGMYVMMTRFEEGIISEKLFIESN